MFFYEEMFEKVYSICFNRSIFVDFSRFSYD
jgi:hypothetical protein